jgi:tetratricopeptide (TPR) repeat protein
MSGEGEDGEATDVCASCGISEIDEIKLKTCTACKSLRYCSVECQKKHRPQHKRACKKRMAELRDELLFRQPESSCFGDCPICCLPIPIDLEKSSLMTCCSKMICLGCSHANKLRQLGLEIPQKPSCAFCREPVPKTGEEAEAMLMKRVEKNDPFAMRHMGSMCRVEGDYKSAFEYWTKAAELVDANAHYNLSVMYRLGLAVEKDEKKEVYHLEVAAIGGHVSARHNLGSCEEINGRIDRAVKHWIIAANMGFDESLKAMWEYHAKGLVKKEVLAATLRAHQAAVDATKSAQREEAEEFFKRIQS